MAIREEYMLGHSTLNEFLYASIAEEKGGMDLTVLSAFARLGLDPWTEAARLSSLTKDAATNALAATITALPEGNWSSANIRSIAVRLVKFLPGPNVVFANTQQVDMSPTQKLGLKVRQGLILVGFGIAAFYAISLLIAP